MGMPNRVRTYFGIGEEVRRAKRAAGAGPAPGGEPPEAPVGLVTPTGEGPGLGPEPHGPPPSPPTPRGPALPPSAVKAVVVHFLRQRYPGVAALGTRGGDEADSLLVALFGAAAAVEAAVARDPALLAPFLRLAACTTMDAPGTGGVGALVPGAEEVLRLSGTAASGARRRRVPLAVSPEPVQGPREGDPAAAAARVLLSAQLPLGHDITTVRALGEALAGLGTGRGTGRGAGRAASGAVWAPGDAASTAALGTLWARYARLVAAEVQQQFVGAGVGVGTSASRTGSAGAAP